MEKSLPPPRLRDEGRCNSRYQRPCSACSPRLRRLRASPCCSSSTEISSGERTKAMRPSRGGRLMVTPCPSAARTSRKCPRRRMPDGRNCGRRYSLGVPVVGQLDLGHAHHPARPGKPTYSVPAGSRAATTPRRPERVAIERKDCSISRDPDHGMQILHDGDSSDWVGSIGLFGIRLEFGGSNA